MQTSIEECEFLYPKREKSNQNKKSQQCREFFLKDLKSCLEQ